MNNGMTKRWGRKLGAASMVLISIIFQFTMGLAQDWRKVTTPAIDIPTSITAAHDDEQADRALLTTEHNGVWLKAAGSNNFSWAFVYPYASNQDPQQDFNPALGVVHIGRLQSAPSTSGGTRVLYALNHHNQFSRSNNDGTNWQKLTDIIGSDRSDPWLAMAIDPGDANHVWVGGTNHIQRTTNGLSNPNTWQNVWGAPMPPNPPYPVVPLVTDLEFDGSNHLWAGTANTTVYPLDNDFPTACAGSGLLRFVKQSGNWTVTALNLGNADANCIYAIAPVYPATAPNCTGTLNSACDAPGKCLYVATKNGLYLTINGDRISPPPDFTLQTIPGVPPNSPISDVFYACKPAPALYASTAITSPKSANRVMKYTSSGWVSLNYEGQVSGAIVNAIGGTPRESRVLYIASEFGNLHKYDERNLNPLYTELNGAHAGYPIATVAIAPNSNGNTIYVGTVCQSGIFKGERNPGSGTWTWTLQYRGPSVGPHDHFHYVMRIIPHLTISNLLYATDQDTVWGLSSPTEPVWDELFPLSGTMRHWHGLAMAPSNADKICVGSGFGNWGTVSAQNKVWCSTDAGTNWNDISGNFPAPPGPCTPGVDESGCTSLISMAIRPRRGSETTDNVIVVGTFGSENDPGKINYGKAIGVVRTTDNGQTWTKINKGLCSNEPNMTCSATQDPPDNSESLFVGTVVIDNSTTPRAFIATLNGIYRMDDAKNGTSWTRKTPIGANRFEAIAVDPDNPNFILAGTSEPGVLEPNQAPDPRIFKSTDGGDNWDPVMSMEGTPGLQRFWSDRFRVRDIQVRGNVPSGQPKAYAVIEGHGIYILYQ